MEKSLHLIRGRWNRARELGEQHVYRLTRSRGGRARSALFRLVRRAHLENKENKTTGNQISLLPLLSKETCLYNSAVVTA